MRSRGELGGEGLVAGAIGQAALGHGIEVVGHNVNAATGIEAVAIYRERKAQKAAHDHGFRVPLHGARGIGAKPAHGAQHVGVRSACNLARLDSEATHIG